MTALAKSQDSNPIEQLEISIKSISIPSQTSLPGLSPKVHVIKPLHTSFGSTISINENSTMRITAAHLHMWLTA